LRTELVKSKDMLENLEGHKKFLYALKLQKTDTVDPKEVMKE